MSRVNAECRDNIVLHDLIVLQMILINLAPNPYNDNGGHIVQSIVYCPISNHDTFLRTYEYLSSLFT